MPEIDITPQQYRGRLSFGHRGFQTGDPAFDRQFMVHSQDEAAARQVLCPPVRSVLLQRDDWCLVIFGYELLSVGKGHYASVDEICARGRAPADNGRRVRPARSTGRWPGR